jgi:spermidine/putrescine transport system ATP-binding protein
MSQGDIQLVELVKRYKDVVAVGGIDLHIPPGEFFTMLGPSGCGKTTTLRLIAGFERPDGGAILLDGVDVSRTPAHKRRVNTVFQSYALFPHKSVVDNVGFGLRYQRTTKEEARRRVAEAMALVRLEGYESRRPSQLSGGQQQRVALARALVLEPPVLLLDEPLGALDARLRLDLQVELKRIQEQLGITFVYVTHDQDEALTMSDRVAVMRDGHVEQCAEPRELYEDPSTAFVANFLGASNLIPVGVSPNGSGSRLRLGSFELHADQGAHGLGDACLAMIRPENVRLFAHGETGENRVPGMVEEVVYLGFHHEVRVRLATGTVIKVDVPNDDERDDHEQGDPVSVHLPARHLRILRAEEDDADDDADGDDEPPTAPAPQHAGAQAP